MSIEAGLLPSVFMWLMFVPAGWVLAWALWSVNGQALRQHTELQHIFFMCCFALTVMWSLRAGISSGMGVHFIGLTLATLLMGWPLAIVCGAVALLGTSFLGIESFMGYGVSFMVSVALPVFTSNTVLRLMQRYLPANPFVYIFVGSFFNGAIAMFCVVSATSILLVSLGVYDWSLVFDQYFIYLPLMMFPEAFINGAMVATFVGATPELLSSFDVDRYFNDD